ncbi:MAG: CHASE domain-containing protein, partial [Candidatus Obscuribacterales bacterium]|nr:CHASE domain-containing protein [Candidatus Obscuribacterales bacterium]
MKPIFHQINCRKSYFCKRLNGDIDHETFQSLAEELVAEDRMIQNVSLLRGTSTVDVYPIKGNEDTIGDGLAGVPNEREAVRQVINTRRTVIEDPVHLVQGGVSIVCRIPVLASPKGKLFGSGEYWG